MCPFIEMPNWKLLELYGYYQLDNHNFYNTLPLDFYVRGYDAQYDEKLEILRKNDYLS